MLVAIAHLFLYFAFPHFYLQERQQELKSKSGYISGKFIQSRWTRSCVLPCNCMLKTKGYSLLKKRSNGGELAARKRVGHWMRMSDQNSVIIEDRTSHYKENGKTNATAGCDDNRIWKQGNQGHIPLFAIITRHFDLYSRWFSRHIYAENYQTSDANVQGNQEDDGIG